MTDRHPLCVWLEEALTALNYIMLRSILTNRMAAPVTLVRLLSGDWPLPAQPPAHISSRHEADRLRRHRLLKYQHLIRIVFTRR